MQIVLLSGGSGKRLWPLSNDIRSKQFIKMFRSPTGEYESMVQRVYRQITAVVPDAQITIATSKKQVSAIKNQLGDKVSICVEPDRRDTFPAIALAAAFLQDVKGVPEGEPVIICPVDPYVEDDYFAALADLAALTKQGSANLNLLGITPTYPSEKYGYIIPDCAASVAKVKNFKEKPDLATAKTYLAQGALWNGGVFAMQLGYLLHRAHALIEFTDYQQLYDTYPTQQKISFDYAVVEYETNIQVLRYAGEWKDLGSWNTFAEAMATPTLGRVTLDDACANTNVVNELDIPLLCMGCKDMVIAASADGILVADKAQSSYIKPYADTLAQQVMYAEKSWGSFIVLDVQAQSLTIKVVLLPNNKLNYHSHQHRTEVWTVTGGSGKAVLDGVARLLKVGDIVTMHAGCKHTVIAGDAGLQLIEVQLGKDITVDDKQKYDMPSAE